MSRSFAVATAMVLMACTSADAPPADEGASSAAETAPAPTDRIGVAMSAAPAAISAAAAIMDFDSTGALVELRPGTNGWMCLPDDNPAAPGDQPICVDGPWQQWFGAYMAREVPQITTVGVSYMLQGGVAASNTDPFAQAPPEGSNWISDGPHLMIIVPDPSQLAGLPTDHSHGGPYVMWAGTPYAHIMIPSTQRP
ncbi:MAG TPA: hypothetical protein VMK53_10725 [Gemmatimonadales bacterium]|nr:hypothetical protein [Gemmatimonadales bacterium]